VSDLQSRNQGFNSRPDITAWKLGQVIHTTQQACRE